MSDDLRNVIDGEAELEEADDESIDEDVRAPRRRERNAGFDDSSEEDEDDEEEARKVSRSDGYGVLRSGLGAHG